MAATTDIAGTWRRPRQVFERLLDQGVREDRAIAYVMIGCFVVFIGQWPRLARVSFETGAELSQLVAYEFLSWLIVWPLLLYGVAAIARLLAKVAGGQGTPFGARLALFWALLASSPAALLYGLVAGFIGPGLQLNITGALWLGALAWFWLTGMRVSEWGQAE